MPRGKLNMAVILVKSLFSGNWSNPIAVNREYNFIYGTMIKGNLSLSHYR